MPLANDMIKPQNQPDNKPAAVTIHTATPDDAPAIARLAQEMGSTLGYRSYCTQGAIASLIRSTQPPSCTLLIAAADTDPAGAPRSIVGFLLYYAGYDLTSDSYGFHIADICVTKGWRRRGVGQQLMAALAQAALEENRDWLSLTVLQGNHKAMQFYRSLGFQAMQSELWAAGKTSILSIVKGSLR